MKTPNNLPAELSSFIGRERQLAELRRLLRKSRLITLTGPGGAGKTRLALRLAASVLGRHPDGVWLVELAAIGDARLLEQTVATACSVREEHQRSILELLVEKFGGGPMLLIFDGCEHLVEASAALASHLLRSCPDLKLLVTSREPLGLPGEVIWRTPSLTVPGLDDAIHREVLLQSEAVRLFVERVRLSRPDFELDQSISAAVALICTRLEGIPLAIELAAGLERIMTPHEILGRLSDRFRLLTGGSRTALPRHQTLRQTVDWSYGLLSPAEKMVLDRLAVFAGGFDVAAAEAVADSVPANTDGLLPVLSRLVDKSLVVAEPGGIDTTRYRLLDTIREYALEKLQPADRADARQRHARYFLEMSSHAAPELRTQRQDHWLPRLDQEQANIRLALDWSMAEQPDDALHLAATMGTYWLMRRHFAEGTQWLGQALELQTSSIEFRPAALIARARLWWRHGEYARARHDAEACVELSRRLGQQRELSAALNHLGLLSGGDGDWSTAKRFFQEALHVNRQLGDHGRTAIGLNNLALIESARGNNEVAKIRVDEAVAEARGTGDRFVLAGILDSQARIALLLGDHAAARLGYLEALAISADFKDPVNIANCLEGLSLLALADGDAARAVRLAAASRTLRIASGGEPTPDWAKRVDDGLLAGRAKLGANAANAAWREGAALSMQDAIDFAAGSPVRQGADAPTALTARERQVALLIAEGLTSPEIAARLKMAGRTADAHVEHIRNKLGLRSRSQIAVWASERLGKRRAD